MNVFIRPWCDEDAMELYHMSMHPFYIRKRIWKYLYPDSFLHALATIHFYQRADVTKFLYRAIVYQGELCGAIACEKTANGKGELSYWLKVDYWHKGIMREAINLMMEEIDCNLKLMELSARVELDNLASQKVLEHNGFEKQRMDNLFIYRRFR